MRVIVFLLCLSPCLCFAAEAALRVPAPPPLPAEDSPAARTALARGMERSRSAAAQQPALAARPTGNDAKPSGNDTKLERARESLRKDVETQVQAARDAAAAAAAAAGACAT